MHERAPLEADPSDGMRPNSKFETKLLIFLHQICLSVACNGYLCRDSAEPSLTESDPIK